nr:hypothetical protein B0A51_09461 [Rachicladosporium sp. CCFEE 5018]
MANWKENQKPSRGALASTAISAAAHHSARPHEQITLFPQPLANISPNARQQSPIPRSLGLSCKPASPNVKPSLYEQRDHSACSRESTPLRVKKTRDNLRGQAGLEASPPPCISHMLTASDASQSEQRIDWQQIAHPRLAPTVAAVLESTGDEVYGDPPNMQRHKSTGGRVLSSIKRTLTSRARSTTTIRPMDLDASLMRRVSGRRRPTIEVTPDRRAYSFDVYRESFPNSREISTTNETSVADRRSFTDSTVSTSALIQALENTTPPCNTPATARTVKLHRCSSPPGIVPERMAQADDVPTLSDDLGHRISYAERAYEARVAYIELHVDLDTTILDAGSSGNMWVAVQAKVSEQPVNLYKAID